MFARDINSIPISEGDFVAYPVRRGSETELGIMRVEHIKWDHFYQTPQPTLVGHIVRHSHARPGTTVKLSRLTRVVKIHG